MANNRQQRQNLQKRNRRVIRLKESKGGSTKSVKKGTKRERAIVRFQKSHAMGGLKAFASGDPVYSPRHKKLKGYQRDHTGKKVA